MHHRTRDSSTYSTISKQAHTRTVSKVQDVPERSGRVARLRSPELLCVCGAIGTTGAFGSPEIGIGCDVSKCKLICSMCVLALHHPFLGLGHGGFLRLDFLSGIDGFDDVAAVDGDNVDWVGERHGLQSWALRGKTNVGITQDRDRFIITMGSWCPSRRNTSS